MATYWERWKTEGQAWNAIFKQMDPILVTFAEEHGCRLTRNHWDAPDRQLSWKDGLIERDIHIYIAGELPAYRIVCEGSAWWESFLGDSGTRYWLSNNLWEIWAENIPSKLNKALLEATFRQVSGWNESLIRKEGKESRIEASQRMLR